MEQSPWDAGGFQALLTGNPEDGAAMPQGGLTLPDGRCESGFVLPDGSLAPADDPRVEDQVRRCAHTAVVFTIDKAAPLARSSSSRRRRKMQGCMTLVTRR